MKSKYSPLREELRLKKKNRYSKIGEKEVIGEGVRIPSKVIFLVFASLYAIVRGEMKEGREGWWFGGMEEKRETFEEKKCREDKFNEMIF